MDVTSRADENYTDYDGQLAVFCRDVKDRSGQYFGDIATVKDGNFVEWNSKKLYLWPKDKEMDFVAFGNFDSGKGIDGNFCWYPNGSKAEFGWDYSHYYVNFFQNSIYDDLQVGVKHAQTNKQKPVEMKLLHALAGVKLKFTNNTPHLNIVFESIEITNIPKFAYYYPPTDDSQWVQDWEQTVGNPESLGNNYRTGTWNNHVEDPVFNRAGYVTIKPEFDEDFLKADNGRLTREVQYGQSRMINKGKPFYLFPHYNFNTEGHKARIIFHVKVWDVQKYGWYNGNYQTGAFDSDAFGEVFKIECDFVPADKGVMGVGRMYTINYTATGRGSITISANVSPFENVDWGFSAN